MILGKGIPLLASKTGEKNGQFTHLVFSLREMVFEDQSSKSI